MEEVKKIINSLKKDIVDIKGQYEKEILKLNTEISILKKILTKSLIKKY